MHYWDPSFLPIKVLYSPILRLRHRVAWEKAIDAVNEGYGSTVFGSFVEAPHKLALELEFDKAVSPPIGAVYVADCHNQGLHEGEYRLFRNANGAIEGAKVYLPEGEEVDFMDTACKLAYKILG